MLARMRLLLAALLIILGAFPAAAHAGPGDLDPGFGTGGSTRSTIGDGDGFVQQADGKLLVTGGSGGSFGVSRYTANGTLDTTFNSGGPVPGSVSTDVSQPFVGDQAIALQLDGKILVAGASLSPGSSRIIVARYTTAGALDPTFNPNGAQPGVASVARTFEGCRQTALAVASDGKIVLAARLNVSTSQTGTVLRLDSTGALDPTFSSGSPTPGIREFPGVDLRGMALDTADRPVIVGSQLVRRLTTAGADDPSFAAPPTTARLNDVTIEPASGKAIVTGMSGGGLLLIRYTATGTPDFTSPPPMPPPGEANAVAVDSVGRIVVAGYSNATHLLARYTTTGALETGPVLTPFGDGNNSEAKDVVIAAGDLPVTAGTAVDGGTFKLNLARFGGTNQTPTASFTFAPANPREGQTVSFDGTASSDPDGTIAAYDWDLDGNGSFETAGATPSRSYATGGPKTVTLRVTDNRGISAQQSRTVTVTANQAPTASFSLSPTPVQRGVTETLDASASSDPDGSVASYQWDFTNDGTFDTQPAASPTTTHAYTALGTTNTRLRVVDNENKTTELVRTFTVTSQPPVASFTATPLGRTVTFDATASSDPDGTVSTYKWDFTNDGVVDRILTAKTTEFTYPVDGAFTARLVVTDDNFVSSEATRNLTVANRAPTAKISADNVKPQPRFDVVSFSAAGSSDADGSVASYKWDLEGDGSYETTTGGPSASEVYPADGDVTVRLKVVDNEGLESAPVSVDVAVLNLPPIAEFTSDKGFTVDQNAEVTFTAVASDPDGTHNVARFEWDFEGSGTFVQTAKSTGTHLYGEPGTYSVGLRVTDGEGKSTTVKQQLIVKQPQPAYKLKVVPFSGTLAVQPGGSAHLDVQVVRLNATSAGVRITTQVPGKAPTSGEIGVPGLTKTVEPVAGKPDVYRVTVDASKAAKPYGPESVVIRALPTSGDNIIKGVVFGEVSVPLTVTVDFDVRVRAIDLTQAIQQQDLATSDGTTAKAAYAGLQMVARKKTIARVIADSAPDLGAGNPTGVTATLSGSRAGKPLPGSPLLPLSNQATLGTIDLAAKRIAPEGAYNFVLPHSWTTASKAGIDLTAQVTPPSVYTDGQIFDTNLNACGTAACTLNDAFKLTGVGFEAQPPVKMRALATDWTRPNPSGPAGATQSGAVKPLSDLTDVTKAMTPVAEGDFYAFPYLATLDVSDVATLPESLVPTPDTEDPPEATYNENADRGDVKTYKINNLMWTWLAENEAKASLFGFGKRVTTGDSTFIVNKTLANGLAYSKYKVGGVLHPTAVVGEERPVHSISHELFHVFGRPHASTACGGGSGTQVGEDWPPDQVGDIQGIGLDPRDGLPTAFKVSPVFDFMSYCSNGEDGWIGTLGWARTIAARKPKPAGRVASATRQAADGGSLYITGYATEAGTVAIDRVSQVERPPDAASASPYSVVVRGTSGAPVVAALQVEAGHIDDLGLATSITGAVPLPPGDRITSLTLLRDGKEVASRIASPHVPTVEITAPKKGARVSGKTVTVAWKQSDADGDALRSTVSYSADGGKTWTVRSMATATTRATLPARYFTASRNARVKVKVSDGLQEATAISGRFAAAGAAPTVTIDPLGKSRIPNDASLYLSGAAYDDADAALTGRALTWKAGRQTIGHGQTISVAGLPASTRKITLLAKDRLGRVGRATVRLRLKAAAPRILTLKLPKKADGSAVLRATASLESQLTVTGGLRKVRAKVGRKVSSVRVRLKGGKQPARLKLKVSAAGRSSVTHARIARR